VPNVGEPTYASDVNAAGIIARGSRSSVVTCTGAEIGILRLDNLALLNGHGYLVYIGNLRVDLTVVTDRPKFLIRYNLTGTATTTSTALARVERAIPTSGEDLNSFPVVTGWIYPTSDTSTASVLLSVVRPTGTGNVLVPPAVASDEPVTMSILDFGIAPVDTGVAV